MSTRTTLIEQCTKDYVELGIDTSSVTPSEKRGLKKLSERIKEGTVVYQLGKNFWTFGYENLSVLSNAI